MGRPDNQFSRVPRLIKLKLIFLGVSYDSTVDAGMNLIVNNAGPFTATQSAFASVQVGTNLSIGSFHNGQSPAFVVIDDVSI